MFQVLILQLPSEVTFPEIKPNFLKQWMYGIGEKCLHCAHCENKLTSSKMQFTAFHSYQDRKTK